MLKPQGRRRVVITNIQPQVGCGQYPAKVIIHQPLKISASVFADGHDELSASVLVRHESEKTFQEIPMTLVNNDHWEATFLPARFGQYLFTVAGWIDHVATWQKRLLIKKNAGQDVWLERQIGAGLLQELKAKDKTHRTFLARLSQQLLDAATETDAFLEDLKSQELAQISRRYADRNLATRHPKNYVLDVERKKAGFSTWYELFPRSASPEPGRHGTFQDVKALLPRVAEMGFDVLYLPPIHPIGQQKRKGKNNSLEAGEHDPGSPWAIGSALGGHKALHPELGNLKDFKSLIAAAKKLDIDIAMDIAFQTAPDHPWVKEHPQWFKWRPDGTVQFAENPPKKYEDILPINFESEDWENLWQELKSVFDYWIAQGVTVFRVDNPHTKSFHFWEWCIGEIHKTHPEVIFLAEAFTRPRLMEQLAKGGFTQSYTYFTWRETKQELQEYLTELTTTEQRWYMRPNFWPNTPDILPKHLTEGGDTAHQIRLILAATLSSNYGLYGPVYEFGFTEPFPGKEEYIDNEKYELKHWDWKKWTKTGELIARVNRIRKENPALQRTDNISFVHTGNDQIICYVKRDESSGNVLIIAVNLDPRNTQSTDVYLPFEQLGLKNRWHYDLEDLLTGDRYTWEGEHHFIQLNPYDMPAHILRLS